MLPVKNTAEAEIVNVTQSHSEKMVCSQSSFCCCLFELKAIHRQNTIYLTAIKDSVEEYEGQSVFIG